jgi:acyl-CoA thioester hydrolase
MPGANVNTTFHVRYAETDQMGVVHHAAYLVWLEEGRSAWMRAHGSSYAQFEKEGLRLAVSEVKIMYRQAAYYDQQVTVNCWVEEVRTRQVYFAYEVIDTATGAVLANAFTKLTSLDAHGRVTTISAKWRDFLRRGGAEAPHKD